MSEQAPERSRGGNVFTRKIGPLPMWQWLLIAGAMLGVYVLMQYRKKNQASASAANTAAGTSTGGTTGAGQVPQFVNQTNTYVSPPAAPQPPPGGHFTGTPPRPVPGQFSGGPPVHGAGSATIGGVLGQNSGSAWLFGSPTSGQSGSIPLGTSVRITGPAVTGNQAGVPGDYSTLYYPVSYNGQTGYISAANIASGSLQIRK